MKVLTAAVAAMILAATAPPAAAERPRADVTPGCVSFEEHDRAAHEAETFGQIRAMLGRSTKRPNPESSPGVSMSPTRYVTFDYPACDGAELLIVYERPNKRHPKTREWAEMFWDPRLADPTVTRS